MDFVAVLVAYNCNDLLGVSLEMFEQTIAQVEISVAHHRVTVQVSVELLHHEDSTAIIATAF